MKRSLLPHLLPFDLPRTLVLALACGLAVSAGQSGGSARPGIAPPPASKLAGRDRQILWQRSLDDALAIAKIENRPLLVAVNMDGESASDRIVRERYRDPAFVALTRSFVCVIASAFRHSPRDHDEAGHRIPCPRLGEVTCGEHVELEPILFDRYLGGERIAPRHAAILPDGAKMTLPDGTKFDLYLLFDLRDLDRRLSEAVKLAPSARPVPIPPGLSGPAGRKGSWSALAQAKDHLGRLALETALPGLRSETECEAALGAISAAGDAGSVEALRILLQRSPAPSAELLDRIAKTAEALRIEGKTAAALRERIAGLGPWPGAPGLDDDGRLLPLLGRLDGGSAPSRSLLLAYSALGNETESALAAGALAGKLAAAETGKIAAAVGASGTRPDVERWWWAAHEPSPTPTPGIFRAPVKLPEERRTAEALEGELSDLDQALDAHPNDPELTARYGKTTLELAQRRMESGGEGAQLLLQDADRFLDRAWQGGKRDATLLFDRAKAAYLAGKHEDEERIALEAEAVAKTQDRVEAERWVGDAAARLLAARSGGDPLVEIGGILRGARALMEVAASPTADGTDWVSLGSFLGALGMRREELAVLQLGAERLPDSPAVRAAMNSALWVGGRIDLTAPKSEWISARNPDSADAAWQAGYARILVGEDRRRSEDPDGAIREYEKGSSWFRRCAELRPDYKENTDHYLALCALGRGFAHLLADPHLRADPHLLPDHRTEAAKCLAEAIALRPAVAATRDGLDREPVDLLDGALEWRESGRSPVDVAALLDAMERAAPGDASWIRGISDSELREALRADGRGEIVEGDRYLRVSIDAARRAAGIAGNDENRRALAQPLTIQGERLLGRGDSAEARKPLAEAATLLGEAAPADEADAVALKALAAKLREILGDARPRFRPGR